MTDLDPSQATLTQDQHNEIMMNNLSIDGIKAALQKMLDEDTKALDFLQRKIAVLQTSIAKLS